MSIKCEIKFDENPYGLYFAGQTISGIVELSLAKAKKVRGLLLEIKGQGRVAWSESHTRRVHGKNKRHTVYYSAKENYLKTQVSLINSALNYGNPIEILPGIHSYNFSCALPHTLPTSMEGIHGRIRYTVRVCLERPWKFDHTYRVAFTVLRPVDLNNDSPMLRIPTKVEEIKTFCCAPCRSLPLIITATTPMSGYVPGQAVYVTIELTNQSNVHVSEVKIQLRKVVKYFSQTPTHKVKIENDTIAEIRCGGVQKKDMARYDGSLLIPAVPASNSTSCRIIHISYEVIVEARVDGMHANPILQIPITIGTIPLFNICSMMQPPITSDQGEVNASAPPYTPIKTPLSSEDMPPPSYEESVYGIARIEDEDDKHPIGFQAYAPRYPVYHFQPNDSQQGPSMKY